MYLPLEATFSGNVNGPALNHTLVKLRSRLHNLEEEDWHQAIKMKVWLHTTVTIVIICEANLAVKNKIVGSLDMWFRIIGRISD